MQNSDRFKVRNHIFIKRDFYYFYYEKNIGN
jgi:hypothetical protein